MLYIVRDYDNETDEVYEYEYGLYSHAVQHMWDSPGYCEIYGYDCKTGNEWKITAIDEPTADGCVYPLID